MHIIGFAGTKRSGKDSALKYLFGHIAVKKEIIEKFDIDNEGNLLVNYERVNPETNEVESGMGIFDIDRKEPEVVQYLHQTFWPFVKQYHFADILKQICHIMYEIPLESLYGTSRDVETQYTWEQLNKILPKKTKNKGKITSRQFIQNIADVLRHMNDKCFTVPTMKRIAEENTQYALVGDVRRIQEVKAIQEAGGKVIYLTRRVHDDNHPIENEFLNVDLNIFDAVIDNANLSIPEKNIKILSIINDWGLLE